MHSLRSHKSIHIRAPDQLSGSRLVPDLPDQRDDVGVGRTGERRVIGRDETPELVMTIRHALSSCCTLS